MKALKNPVQASKGRYAPEELEARAQDALRDGFCVLRGQVSQEKIRAWQQAFAPLLEKQIALEGSATSRGSHRYYVTLPFMMPFADPSIFEDPDILAIVEKLVGKDAALCQLASDTPVLGSDYQSIHSDAPPLFPETDLQTPMFQLAVNFPLVDVTDENGPFEVARGTHMLPKAEGMRRIESGEIRIEALKLKVGDVMIRDVRTLHRGTPNRTNAPRPMVVLGYNRRWLHRPEVSIRVPRDALESLSERARQLLRFNPVVDRLELAAQAESYRTFSY